MAVTACANDQILAQDKHEILSALDVMFYFEPNSCTVKLKLESIIIVKSQKKNPVKYQE